MTTTRHGGGWDAMDIVPEGRKKCGAVTHELVDPRLVALRKRGELTERQIEDALLKQQCGEVWE